MKISIENFKSIRSLQNFEIKPFMVLSGVNSAGKSSFVQLLLILKQTIQLNSASNPFDLESNLYKVGDFSDIVYIKQLENKIKVSFEFNKNELIKIKNSPVNIYNYLDDYKSKISFQFDFLENIIVERFNISIELPESIKSPFISFNYNKEKKTYSIEANDDIFGVGIWNENLTESNVNFLAFYPLYCDNKTDKKADKIFIEIDWVKSLIDSFLNNISYIEPNRKAPEDEYIYSKNQNSIGTKGQYTAQIIKEKASLLTEFYKITELEYGSKYELENNKTLIEAVKYWMCDVFEVAEDIKAEKVDESYKIILINKSGLKTSIKHVGFGISQLLPVVVEGLLMSKKGTLIVEQPEIHIHPKIQSQLFDFLYGLIKQGKKVIVETHSSHFITRMRRRIAEDESNKMDDTIGLTFIEGNIFRSIELDDYGTMDYYPINFIEQSNTELKAIIKAQMKKRAKND